MSCAMIATYNMPAVDEPQLNPQAFDLVAGAMDDAKTFAAVAETRALDTIALLGQFQVDLPPIAVPDVPVTDLPIPSVDAPPAQPTDLSASFPTAPMDPTLGALTPFSLDTPPDFTASMPVLAELNFPNPLTATVPSAPSLDLVSVPVAPDFVLPVVPDLLALNLPAAPTLDLPSFNAALSDMPTAPDVSFAYAESAYQTALLGAMNSRLLDFVNGASTGLTPEVEQAIWNRGRDREAAQLQRAIDEAQRMFAARGFELPGGTLATMIQQAVQDSIGRDVSLSRDVMIKQAELEQSNFHFAFQTAMQLESRLIEHFDQVQTRALDAAKYAVQAVLEIFRARVMLYQADVQAFQARAAVYETQLKAALAQLDVYRAELDGQKLIGELNVQQVEIYKGMLQGVLATADIYKTQVSAANLRIEANNSLLAGFREQVNAYVAQVQAKNSEYEGYATQVKAEVAQVQMFGEEVNAYKSRIEAYGALVNARLGAATLEFKQLQEFPLEAYKARIGAFGAQVAAEAERLKALTTVYDTEVKAYSATEDAKARLSMAGAEVVKATAGAAAERAKVAVAVAEANGRLAVASHETAQASLRAAGQLAGQLAAAAMAARNVHASIQSSASAGTSVNTSRSFADHMSTSISQSCNDNYSHSDN